MRDKFREFLLNKDSLETRWHLNWVLKAGSTLVDPPKLLLPT